MKAGIDMTYEIWKMPMNNPNKFLHYDWCDHPIVLGDYVHVYTGKIARIDTDERNVCVSGSARYPPLPQGT